MMQAYEDMPAVYETFVEASEVLHQDLWALVAQGPAEALNHTVNTQPLMLTAGVAVYRSWLAAQGMNPVYFAGHSLGEYTALVAAKALDFHAALLLVRYRAQLMQQAVPAETGAMAALLGLEDEAVRSICVQAAGAEIVEAVNYNAPGQVVIAGHRNAVLRAMDLATAHGAKRAIILPVSVPAHSSLMSEAGKRLAQYMETVDIIPPATPVLQNADVTSFATSSEIKQALVKQLSSPVRWVETIQKMAQQGLTHIIECGPGKILTGLNKRISSVPTLALADARSILEFKSA